MALSTFFDHFKAIQRWAARHDAEVEMNVRAMQLEIRCANLYFSFFPIFAGTVGDRLVHFEHMADSVVAFGGWRPYRPYTTRFSTEKLIFKQHLREEGVLTPESWPLGVQPTEGYIRKKSRGSFGYDIQGPFLASVPLSISGESLEAPYFQEQFVPGKVVKVWFWGHQPFFAEIQDYAKIIGTGELTVAALAEAKIKTDLGASVLADKAILEACVAYQGLAMGDVLEAGREVWIDFRYGRTFAKRTSGATTRSDLHNLMATSGDQILRMGGLVRSALQEVTPSPLAYSVDAVLDEQGRLWWLELNSHPMFPHAGYDVMLCDIFNRTPHGSS